MANRIQQKIRKLEFIRDNLQSEANKIIMKHEEYIIRLNTSQFEYGKGSDGKKLNNKNKKYSGTYTYFTQQVALFENPIAPKIEGQLYNFAWTGDFLNGMQVDIKENGEYKIFSTGVGTGGKALFFANYTNLFGLDDYSRKLLRDKIMPELRAYLKSKL